MTGPPSYSPVPGEPLYPGPEPPPWVVGPYGVPAYGAPPYAPYGPYPYGGYPVVAMAPPRPGAATASAVLAFVLAGLLALAGLLLFFSGAVAADIETAMGSGTHLGLELAIDGVVDLAAGGVLIAGGVALLDRGPAGRTLLSGGGAVVLIAAVYWLTRFSGSDTAGLAFSAAWFTGLAVLVLALAWTSTVTRWLSPPR